MSWLIFSTPTVPVWLHPVYLASSLLSGPRTQPVCFQPDCSSASCELQGAYGTYSAKSTYITILPCNTAHRWPSCHLTLPTDDHPTMWHSTQMTILQSTVKYRGQFITLQWTTAQTFPNGGEKHACMQWTTSCSWRTCNRTQQTDMLTNQKWETERTWTTTTEYTHSKLVCNETPSQKTSLV